jgi:cyclophilin family peptidyl-prolyl cis-trans isomerase
LEVRNLLAGDVLSELTAGAVHLDTPESAAGDYGLAGFQATSAAVAAEGEGVAEGEDQPDLVAFAKALDQAGVKYYGGAWCAHCTDQKELFEDGADFLPFIEVTNPDRTLNQIGQENNISSLPTWEFPDESRLTGVQSLQTISERAGVAIPTSSAPSLAPIDDVTVLGGSPLHIPLDGYDPNGGPLTYTISVNGSVVTGTLLEGNRSMRVDVSTYGQMVFQLFEDRAPRPTGRVIELAEDDFYDGILFHRVIDGFVIQGGDPTGTGTGGSTLGDFDDQFHVQLQHNRAGMLSFAKSGDDTNDSQFFVTLGPTRHLDFNHSVFGIMVEGYHQLESIGMTATGAGDRPTFDIPMNTVDIFTDTENAVLMLSAAEGASGTAEVTVTVTDADGNSSQQTFNVDVLPDVTANGGANGGPFLHDIDPVTTNVNTAAQIQLSAVDVEGDAVYYDASASGSVNYTLDVNHETGLVTVTPPTGFEGQMQVLVGVRPLNGSDTSDTFDQQLVTITVEGEGETLDKPVLDLLAASDSNVDTDNVTNVTNMTFRVTNVVNGAVVQILSGETVIGQGTASGTSIDITTNNLAALGDGTYSLTAVQSQGDDESPASDVLQVTLDTTAPAAFTTTAPDTGIVAHLLRYDVQHADEGTAQMTYSLVSAPSGAAIDPQTGVLTWTPASAQTGTNDFQIVGTDLAGNTVTQNVSIDVTAVEQIMQIRLETQSVSGEVIDTISVGQNFWLRVYVKDLRTEDADGVFAAYLDVNYDSALASAIGEDRDDIVYGDDYQNGRSGSLTTPGLMDEIGAFGPTSPLDDAERLLLMVSMTATAEGELLFYGDPGDAIGSDALVFGMDQPVPWEAVSILSTTLNIGAGVTANDDVYNVDEDSDDNDLDVLSNDTADVAGTPTITAVGATNHGGTVTIAGDGQSLIYTPAADYFGEEEFTYTIDLNGSQSTATVTVQVHPVNDAPTANDDDFAVAKDSDDNFLNVLGNDEIAPDANETLRVTAVGTPSHGTVQIAPNGTHLLYTPTAGFAGEDTFTYTVSDGTGSGALTSQATITISIEDLPTPTVGNDAITVTEDSAATEIDVLANDSPETTGADLTIEAVSAPPSGGQVNIIENGQKVTYKPPANFQGTDTFTYTVREEDGGTATATVTVTVTNVNDPPTANDDEYDVLVDDGTQTLDVLANDSLLPDPDGTLTITAVTQGSTSGTVSIAADGKSIRYTPASGFQGTETFTYTLDDGSGLTDTATVTVNVLVYVPRDVLGNAVLNGLNGVGGLAFYLAGTDDFDETIAQTTNSTADGSFHFDDLAPGTYKINRTSAAFLLDDGVMEITIDSEMDDDDHTGTTFQFSGRKAQFMSIADLLVTAPQQSPLYPAHSVTIAAEPGGDLHWYSVLAGWEDYVSCEFELSEDRDELTVTAVDEAGDEYTATVDTTDSSLVKWLGKDNGVYLLRLDGGPDDIELEAVDDAEAEGEGEAPLNAASLLATPAAVPVATTGSTDQGENASAGEGEAAPSLSTVPVANVPAAWTRTAPLQTTLTTVDQVVDDALADATASSVDAQPAVATAIVPRLGGATPVSTTASPAALVAVDAAVQEHLAGTDAAESSVVDAIADSAADDEREIVIDTIFSEDSLLVMP